jgi:S-DNA-T family DNA segregation ATPase FtsK/SpoIIIE
VGVLPDEVPLPRGPLLRRVPLGLGGDGPEPVLLGTDHPLLVTGAPGSGRSTALRTVAAGWDAAGWRTVVVDAASGSEALEQADAGTALLVDDLDEIERHLPATADRLEQVARGEAPGRLAAVATTAHHASTAFRGVVPVVARSRRVLVLDPEGPTAADLLGAPWALHVDPWRRLPGRGVLRRDRRLVRVQVHGAP